jgi:hypothetical protein
LHLPAGAGGDAPADFVRTLRSRAGGGDHVGRSFVDAKDESMQALDDTLDALVVEALRPLRHDSSSVPSVRALTDVEMWRTLRHQGASPEAAVDQASEAVERWLEARPARLDAAEP